MEEVLNGSTGLVARFHQVFNHPIAQAVGEETLEVRQLRIKLLFEELRELAEATDCTDTFARLAAEVHEDTMNILVKGDYPHDGNNVDHVAELDALCDLQVVLDGKILTSGHYKHFSRAFKEVHVSNMSKACRSADEASICSYEYSNKGILTYKEKVEDYYVVKRSSDGKILKGPNFKEPDLKKILDSE